MIRNIDPYTDTFFKYVTKEERGKKKEERERAY